MKTKRSVKKPMLSRVYDRSDRPLLDKEIQLWGPVKGEKRTLEHALTSDYVYFDAGTLPEIIIRPPKDNAVYKANYMIPNKELRNLFYNSINEDYDLRLYVNRLWNLYNKAQRPTIKSTESDLNILPFLLKMGIIEGTSGRANYNSLFNTMFVSPDDTANDIESELAHAYQSYGTDTPRKRGVIEAFSLPGDIKIDGKTGYERPGNKEFNAHSIIEPLFNLYLTNKDIYYNDVKTIIDDMYNPANRSFYFPEITAGPYAGYTKQLHPLTYDKK